MNYFDRQQRGAWSVLDDLMGLQNEFNRYFDGLGGRWVAEGYPPVNTWVSGDNLVVDVELPGIDPKSVDVSVHGNDLRISGKREPEQLPKEAVYHRRERHTGEFSRALELPFEVESAKVTAAYRNGILRVILPRAEADKPKKIKIEAA